MIRQAEMKDIPRIIDLAYKFYTEGEFSGKGLKFNPESFKIMCIDMISKPNHKVILISEENEGINGMIGAYIAPWFCDFSQSQLIESWFYVEQKFRGKYIAVRLLKELEKMGLQAGCVNIKLASLPNDRQDRMDIYYKRLGYKLSDRFYSKEINHD